MKEPINFDKIIHLNFSGKKDVYKIETTFEGRTRRIIRISSPTNRKMKWLSLAINWELDIPNGELSVREGLSGKLIPVHNKNIYRHNIETISDFKSWLEGLLTDCEETGLLGN